MAHGAHAMEGVEPAPEPQDAHHDHADRLTELRRDALGADRLVSACEQCENRIAKLTHPGSGPCVLGRCQRSRRGGRTGFRAVARSSVPEPDIMSGGGKKRPRAFCPAPAARYRHTAIDSPTCAARN